MFKAEPPPSFSGTVRLLNKHFEHLLHAGTGGTLENKTDEAHTPQSRRLQTVVGAAGRGSSEGTVRSVQDEYEGTERRMACVRQGVM